MTEEDLKEQRHRLFFERWKDSLPMFDDFLTPDEVDDFPKIPTKVIEYSENLSNQAKRNWASFDGVQDVYSNIESTMFFRVNKSSLEATYLGCFDSGKNIEIPKRIVTPDWYECLVISKIIQ